MSANRTDRPRAATCAVLRWSARLALLALAGLGSGCSGERPVDRLALQRGLALSPRGTLAVPEALLGLARETQAERARATPDLGPDGAATRIPVFEVQPLGAAGRRGPRIVVGTWDEPEVARLATALGLEGDPDGETFRLAGWPELALDLVAATWHDPERRGLPVTLLVARRTDDLVARLGELVPSARPSISAWRNGALVAEGELELDGRPRAGRIRIAAGQRPYEAAATARAPGILLSSDAGLDQQRALEHLAEVGRRLRAAVGVPAAGRGSDEEAPAEQVRVRHFAHPEDLSETSLRSAPGLAGADGGYAVLLSGDALGLGPAGSAQGPVFADGGAAYAEALARQLLGRPRETWLPAALAVHAADRWWDRPLEPWGARLARAGLAPAEPAALFDPASTLSPHVLVPLRALYLRGWLASTGAEALRELWSGALPFDPQAGWTAFLAELERLAEAHAPALDAARSGRRTAILEQAFFAGANLFAPLDEGAWNRSPRGPLGFGTRACEHSLRGLAGLGANAVAVLVEGVSFAGAPRTPLSPPPAGPHTLASDLELVATLAAARRAGLSPMVRPLLLERPSGTWAGDHAEENERRHAVFFERYRAYVVHLSLVAELGGADFLCTGTELARATRTDPEADPWIPDYTNLNGALWGELLARARGAFDGELTYAADARGEAERIPFLAELDRPAIDLYGPLVDPPDFVLPHPDSGADGELVRRIRWLLQRADQLGLECGAPCLITEFGAASSALACEVNDESRGPADLEEQTRILAALVTAYVGLKRPFEGIGGLYLLGWSTDPDAGRELDQSFTVQNRPAAAEAERLFRRLLEPEDG